MQYFDAFMKNITSRNKGRVISDPVFSRHKRILDVGGSTGDIAVSLAQCHPGLEVTVLDFPEVVKLASHRFRDCGLEKRLHTLTGDPLKELPVGFDCMLFFHFFDIFSPQDIRRLLRNAQAALPAGGSICIFTPVSYSQKVTHSDLLGPYFLCLAEGQGKFYPEENIVEWVKEEKFKNVSVNPLPFDEVFVTAEKS
jgi:cyclopropane fatty-acyl-phospholipid synthase-like methyltransferase